MRRRQFEYTVVETVQTPQIALIGQVQKHQVQDTGSVEGIQMALIESKFDFLHGYKNCLSCNAAFYSFLLGFSTAMVNIPVSVMDLLSEKILGESLVL